MSSAVGQQAVRRPLTAAAATAMRSQVDISAKALGLCTMETASAPGSVAASEDTSAYVWPTGEGAELLDSDMSWGFVREGQQVVLFGICLSTSYSLSAPVVCVCMHSCVLVSSGAFLVLASTHVRALTAWGLYRVLLREARPATCMMLAQR